MTRLLAIIFFLFASLNGIAQKSEAYYDNNWRPCSAENARYFSITDKIDTGWIKRDFFIPEKAVQMIGTYKDQSCKIRHGYFSFYHVNKTLESTGAYSNGKKQGLWMSYHSNGIVSDSSTYLDGNIVGTSMGWFANGFVSDSAVYNADGSGIGYTWYDNGTPSSAGRYSKGYKENGKWQFFHNNGNLSALETYANGILVNKEYFDEQGASISDTTNHDRKAYYSSGSKAWGKYLDGQLYFPSQYNITSGAAAVVVLQATINEDGSVSNVVVTKHLHPAFDEIALKAIQKSPKWQPAISHNRKIKYRITQSISFSQENHYFYSPG